MLLTCIKKLLISFYGLIQLLFHFHVIFSNFPRIKKKVKKLVCFSSFDIFCSVQASYKEKICIKMVILYISLVLKKKKICFFCLAFQAFLCVSLYYAIDDSLLKKYQQKIVLFMTGVSNFGMEYSKVIFILFFTKSVFGKA